VDILDSPSLAIAACGGFCYAYINTMYNFSTKLMRTEDKKRIDFYATPDESKILEDYCAATGKTKTAVLRELLQSLATAGLKSALVRHEIPEHWLRQDDGSFVGRYRGAHLSIFHEPIVGYWVGDVHFPGYNISFQRGFHPHLMTALALAEQFVDSELLEQGLRSGEDRY
jgi:hypothetical protein